MTARGATVHFPVARAPLVSVIMLAWRLTDELLEALGALALEADERVEVIVVLNGALPAVQEAVAREVHGATVITAPYNVGYGGGCNRGASVARGAHLVFLSDDTKVAVGWLDAMLTAVAEHPEAGLVASVLVEPDGTIQEAGSRMLSDGTTIAYGAGRILAEVPEFLHDRPIDYGSGAALMIERDLFIALGGFDPAFYPAYYEDVDLAFRARAAGRPVILAANARVTHIGRASTGRGRYQRFASDHGLAAFLDRWSKVLDAAPRREAPITELCPVERTMPHGVIRVSGLDEVDELSGAEGALSRALESSRLNVQWLESYLDASEANTVAATDRLAVLVDRMSELESRGPVGIVKWRVGVWIAKRPALASRFRSLGH